MKKLAVVLFLAMSVSVLRAADISGTWSAAVVLDAGSGTATFVFEQKGEALSGSSGTKEPKLRAGDR